MKKLSLLLLTCFSLLFTMSVANAAIEQSDINLLKGKAWVEFGKDDSSVYYIRPDAIVEVRPLVYSVPIINHVVSSYNEHVEDGDVILTYNVFSCILRQSATFRYAHFSKEAGLKSDYSWNKILWEDVKKDTYQYYILQLMCKTQEY